MLSRKTTRKGSPGSYLSLTRYTLQQTLDHVQFSSDSDGDSSSFLNEFPLSRDGATEPLTHEVSSSYPTNYTVGNRTVNKAQVLDKPQTQRYEPFRFQGKPLWS